jgi:ParB family chromosome partitioning protein
MFLVRKGGRRKLTEKEMGWPRRNQLDYRRGDERIIEIELERLRDFKNHPFRIADDEQMQELIESIKYFGILNPLIVRPLPEGVYEVISGHRRKYAADRLGYRKVPVVIRVMSDEEAVIGMVDANLQRAAIHPSERAFAIKMRYEAMRRLPGRKKGGQDDQKIKGIRTVQILGKEIGDSPKQVQRYLKITELIPELLELLDNRKISFNPAYEVAFLKRNEQKELLEAMRYLQSTPSLSQAQRIKALSQEGTLNLETIKIILSEIKKGSINRVMFKNEQLYQFFPRDYTAEQMKQEILEILKSWMNSGQDKGRGAGRRNETDETERDQTGTDGIHGTDEGAE